VNQDQARTLREACDAYVKFVYSKPKSRLAVLYATEQADRGRVTVFGGPSTRDEFARELIELRYPAAKMNETIHVLYHQDFASDACAYCDPHPCPVCGAIDACTFTGNESGAIVNGRHVNA
jgi:hypothetical protein